ncbi:nitric oxide synthase oxygenase [Streptomyces sp. NPDC052236]|uniref:nitric oxide synthase oxygenase n=1 Tax=Streptomyces sp. NPDC052236 TaxID=3365686 RepID=UPI0037D2C432
MTRAATAEVFDVLPRAEEFIELFFQENGAQISMAERLREIRGEIRRSGTYAHTPEELAFGARVAWRNSKRCIGRIYWQRLAVRDRRQVNTAEEIHRECARHLREAFNGGRIRPTITVFAPEDRNGAGPRIHNEQLIRYAGYRQPGNRITGDPAYADFTDRVRALGWPGGPGTAFDVLPLLIGTPGEAPRLFELPPDAVHEVHIQHPEYAWFAGLGLRWHAVPVISNMTMEIGGVRYSAAPFNGWYMGTEIGARNLVDQQRYDLLPELADRMGLDRTANHTLWKDRALVELNLAVLWSFRQAGITISDHHTESERFLRHVEREEKAGRAVPADWSWIVPPLSGGITPVFHRYYDDDDPLPNFLKQASPASPAVPRCPGLERSMTDGTPDGAGTQPPIPAGIGATDGGGDGRDHIA